MKHLIILLMLAFLLTGCSIVAESDDTENEGFQTTETTSYAASEPDISEPIAEVTSALTTAQTDTAPSMSIETAEPDVVSTTAATSSTVTTAATTPTAATDPQPVPQTTASTATIEAPAALDTTGTVSEETEPPVEESHYDLPVFIEYGYTTRDGAQREYLLVTVIPEKIYWNDPERFDDVKEGIPLNILIPAVMYDTIKNSDSVVLSFDGYNSFPNPDIRYYPKHDSDMELTYDNVMGRVWGGDDLYTIKDGVLTEFEITDEMRNFGIFGEFERVPQSSIMLDYNEFFYGMTVEELDTFYDDTHRKIVEMEEYAEEVRKELNDYSYHVGCDLVSYTYFLEGTVMRVRLE